MGRQKLLGKQNVTLFSCQADGALNCSAAPPRAQVSPCSSLPRIQSAGRSRGSLNLWSCVCSSIWAKL